MSKKDIRPIARAVCAALGATLKHDAESDWYASAVMPDGVTIGLHLGYGKSARLEASVSLPGSDGSTQTPRDVIEHDERAAGTFTTSITCDPDKAPEKIAADIRRRLLPSATTLHARAVERARQQEQWAAGKELTIATLCQRLRVEKAHGSRIYAGPATVDVSGPDSIRFDSFYCSAETAAKVVELLRKEKPDA